MPNKHEVSVAESRARHEAAVAESRRRHEAAVAESRARHEAAARPSALEQFLHGQRTPVASTYCIAMAFEPNANAITVWYGDGAVWNYSPYTAREAQSLFESSSKGEWIWNHIRVRGPGGKHKHRRGAAKA